MYNVLWKENESIFSSGLVPNIGFVVGFNKTNIKIPKITSGFF
jgi:hypothetical protein